MQLICFLKQYIAKVPVLTEVFKNSHQISTLGASLAALLHHTPVLRAAHVAEALFRASVPQAINKVKFRSGPA